MNFPKRDLTVVTYCILQYCTATVYVPVCIAHISQQCSAVLGRRPALPSRPAHTAQPATHTPLGAANSLAEDIRWCQVLCHRSTLTSA